MPAKLRTKEEIIAEQKTECSFFGYGKCSTRACLMGKHPNLQFVGCLAYQTILALKGEPIKGEPIKPKPFFDETAEDIRNRRDALHSW